jgi:hypothetical protein
MPAHTGMLIVCFSLIDISKRSGREFAMPVADPSCRRHLCVRNRTDGNGTQAIDSHQNIITLQIQIRLKVLVYEFAAGKP